ncbi:MAG: HEAT repeat domain-containing protein [Gemmatimonadaceae bacterium]
MRPCLLVVAACAILAREAAAQSLAERVRSAKDDNVVFHFTPRAGVCGDGRSFVRMGHSYQGSFNSGDYSRPCEPGPVQVQLTLRNGEVEGVQAWVGRMRARDAQDLGTVPAPEAARYLLSIAASGRSSASAKAIFPAVLADSATVWPALLTIAKDRDGRSRQTREDASFWLSRFAAGAIDGRPNQPFDDDDDGTDSKDDLKSHAVFVLSQLPHGEGIPNLLDVVRSRADVRVRGKALFWLGQSGDPRALELFEALLK